MKIIDTDMKIYKKPVSILVEVDAENILAGSLEGEVFNGGTSTDASGEIQLMDGGTTSGSGTNHGDAKGFDTWE